ncbi:hypothetical protein O9992_27870 [Vibrio lentus]|nr:hypothetical protein [Vibrio lentus]
MTVGTSPRTMTNVRITIPRTKRIIVTLNHCVTVKSPSRTHECMGQLHAPIVYASVIVEGTNLCGMRAFS